MNNATRLNRLEVLEEVKFPFADGSAVVSPDAAEAAGETPSKAEFDAAVALLNELKEKFNDLVVGFGGPEPPPTPNKAPEPRETLIKETLIPDVRQDAEPEAAGDPDAAEPEIEEPEAEPESEAEDPEPEAPEAEPEQEAPEAEAEPEPEPAGADEAGDAPEEPADAPEGEEPESLN